MQLDAWLCDKECVGSHQTTFVELYGEINGGPARGGIKLVFRF